MTPKLERSSKVNYPEAREDAIRQAREKGHDPGTFSHVGLDHRNYNTHCRKCQMMVGANEVAGDWMAYGMGISIRRPGKHWKE